MPELDDMALEYRIDPAARGRVLPALARLLLDMARREREQKALLAELHAAAGLGVPWLVARSLSRIEMGAD